MDRVSLRELAADHLTKAASSGNGRSAETVYGGRGRALRQTLVALVAGTALGEHESPGDATVHVLSGRVRLTSGDDACEAGAGDLVAIPDARHDLRALEDSVILLTVGRSAG